MQPHPDFERAVALAQRGALREAEGLLAAILRDAPGDARSHNALGVVRMQLGRLEEAAESLRTASRLDPMDPRPHLNLGKLFLATGDARSAEAEWREALRLAPSNADAAFNLGALLQSAGRLDEAETCFADAVRATPADAELHAALARVRLEMSRFTDAEAAYAAALRLRPDLRGARADLALIQLETGRLADAERTSLEAARSGELRAWSNAVMCAQYDPARSDEALLALAREAGSAMAATTRLWGPSPPPRGAGGQQTLSIGIVSADLHHHPVGLLLLPVLRELAKNGLRATLYSNGTVKDAVSAELARHAEWRDIAAEPDEAACARLRSAGHDVVIDLAGHTGRNRLALFAARTAPLQISWLGYFGTTGMANMDCVLMDPWHAPPGCETQFTERVLRMPNNRFCFQPIAEAPAIAAQSPSVRRGYVTFGSFNSLAKLNDEVIEAWARILAAVPDSRLVLKWRTLVDAACRRAIAARFSNAGVAADRLELRGPSSHAAVLAEYADIDIALDPFPFTGGQTSFDATWMGVPIVTLAGTRPVSRQTLSIYGNIGLEALATRSLDAYVERAREWAKDESFRTSYRATIRERLGASPLMDASRFARDFAAVLRNAVAGV